MKILFTADWHINLRKKNVPIKWAKDRYKQFFEEIHKAEQEVDLHIIGGDIFDKIPNLEELDVYFDYLRDIKCKVIIYDGNHEATKKHHTFFDHLRSVSMAMAPRDVDIVTKTDTYVDFTIVPYADLHRKDAFAGLDHNKILFTHVRGEIPPHVKPEIDLDLLKDFKTVVAGDLHSHSNTQRNILYPGSPMTCDFHRNEVSTGFVIIDSLTHEWDWHELKLPQLIRKTVSSPEEMVPTSYNYTIYELEGNLSELASVPNTELLDKKVIKRSTETALLLDDMTMEQELAEYLSYILEIDDIDDIMKVFNDFN